MRLKSTLILVGMLTFGSLVDGEDLSEPFDHFKASDLATNRAEADRRDAIALQLATIDEMKWYAGLPTLRQPVPPSLDYIYAYGPQLSRTYPPVPYYGVFEPWP